MKQIPKTNNALQEDRLFRIKAGAFLAGIGGISSIAGFGLTLASAKKADPKYFNKGIQTSAELADAGVMLAMRALGWGSLCAVAGTSFICYGIWKLSEAKSLVDFREKMGRILPKVPRNDPPRSRTEFSGLNDLLTYISTEKFGDKQVIEEKQVK